MRWVGVAGLATLMACSTPKAPDPSKPAESANLPSRPPRDLSRMLPPKGLAHSAVVPNHAADFAKLPAGTVGDYEEAGRKYQIFIVEADGNQGAAFLLLDMKGALKDPEYLASFGGYFASDTTGRPVFVFAKNQFLAGIVGLTKDGADPIARILAARLK